MDRSMWTNRSRRMTIMGERNRSGNSKIANKIISKPSSGKSANKENESRGAKRNVLGGHTLGAKNERKEVSSRLSITRRLSFHKTELESVEESPFHSPGIEHDSYQDVDESMLYPLYPTRVMGNSPSPFRLDLLQKGEQKKDYPSLGKQFDISKYDSVKSNSNEKLKLSDKTKTILKNMGIETSPDLDVAKKDGLKRIHEKKSEEIVEQYTVDNNILTRNQKSEVYGESYGMSSVLQGVPLDKDHQTTQQLQASAVARELSGDAFHDLMARLNSLHIRHFQEREELYNKQKKEVEEFTTCLDALLKVPSENVAGASRQVTGNINEKQVPVICVGTEQPPGIPTILPPQNCTVPLEGTSSPLINIATDFNSDKSKTPVEVQGTVDKPRQLESTFDPQNWRRQEVSLIETPQAGRWLVTEDFGEELSVTSTPTLGLNSMLQGMSIQGQQPFNETPATRRLVTNRILKEVESLFF